MSNFNKILDSFSIKSTLNPKVWDNPSDPKKSSLKPKIQKGLMKIAEKFIDFLGDDVFVEDIVLMGSLVNYNWSDYSDFDLHVLVDFKQYEKLDELYRELFDLKKKIFNDRYDIKIYGYDVELYAQGADDEHSSAGVYSVMNDEWISIPKKEKLEIDQNVLKRKIKCWTDKIDDAVETSSEKDDEEILKTLKDKLKEYRKSGLEKNGEFSYENLVFKFLRRSGHIGKLFEKRKKITDKKLSIERKLEESLKNKVKK